MVRRSRVRVSGASRNVAEDPGAEDHQPSGQQQPEVAQALHDPQATFIAEAGPGAHSGGTTVSLGAPIENVSDPAIGCPSAETTR